MLEQLAEKYLSGNDVTQFLPWQTGQILTRWIEHEYQSVISTGIQIEETENGAVYPSSHSMIEDVENNNHLFVFSLFNEHPLWSKDTNRRFRVVHDYKHHFESNACENGFTLYGEFAAYQKATSDLFRYMWQYESVPTLEIYPTLDRILYSEIVLQAAVKLFTGELAAQKIVF